MLWMSKSEKTILYRHQHKVNHYSHTHRHTNTYNMIYVWNIEWKWNITLIDHEWQLDGH